MTIIEFCRQTGVDYDSVLDRLLDERRYAGFVRMFKDDPSYDRLEAALADRDTKKAFQAAHTLKGVCLNIGFSRLLQHADAVTEALRDGNLELALEKMPGLRSSYREIVEKIDQIEA